MTWGRALENALTSKGISKEFGEWFAIAKDRPKWSPNAWWLKDTTRVNYYNCVMQKGTQPNQTCSEDYTFLLLYVAGVFFVFGE